MELHGYHSTRLNQIVAESGAPKGSLYPYFPDGKDGLVEEAIAHTRQIMEARLREGMAAYTSPVEAIPHFLRNLAPTSRPVGFRQEVQ
jgi:TetR/AcrR family transcriptional repressor of lmrAB and yxaGH operons